MCPETAQSVARLGWTIAATRGVQLGGLQLLGDVGLLLGTSAAMVVVGISRIRAPRGKDIGAGAAGIVLGWAVFHILQPLVVAIGVSLGFPRGLAEAATAPILATSLVAGPVLEELLFRERVFAALEPAPPLCVAVVSAILFAASHLPSSWESLASLLLGLVLAALYFWSRSLVLCIGVHAGCNGAFLL